jgi:hypothetical protein
MNEKSCTFCDGREKILILFIVELLLYLTSVNIYDSLITNNVDMLFV